VTYVWAEQGEGRREVRDRDLYEFSGDKARRKNAFRKTFG